MNAKDLKLTQEEISNTLLHYKGDSVTSYLANTATLKAVKKIREALEYVNARMIVMKRIDMFIKELENER